MTKFSLVSIAAVSLAMAGCQGTIGGPGDSEPGSGNANNFKAQGIFAMLVYKWP